MNCTEALSTLSTASLRDMTPDSPLMLHCADCPDCARVTTALREREYEAASVLNELPPLSSPIAIAEQSALISRRRRIGNIAMLVTGIVLVLTTWGALSLSIIPALNRGGNGPSTLLTETIQLSCLSPKQAGDIISPYVRSHGSAYYLPSSGLSAITVRGTRVEIDKSRSLLGEFESDPNASCRVAVDPERLRRQIDAVQQGVREAAHDQGVVQPKAPTAPPTEVPREPKAK